MIAVPGFAPGGRRAGLLPERLQNPAFASSPRVAAAPGVILAGGLVALSGLRLPDLVIGAIIAAIALSGGLRILRLS